MIRSFRSVFMVASCAGAALGCYLVSLRVASERAAVESVETKIVLTQRDIRLLQTEIGTRGRLAQLERWNVKVLALSAPSADQFLDGGFALARMIAPRHEVDLEAPVVLASAPADGPRPRIEGVAQRDPEQGVSASQMLHTASLNREIKPDETAVDLPKPVATSAPAPFKLKPVRLAQADPLAPQPTQSTSHATAKDAGRKQ
ncbi:MAG: hypothetical protein ABIT68_04575 [Sphingomicrobium sp.]